MLIATFIWGTAFVSQTTGMGAIGPFTFSASRFFLASLTVLPLLIIYERKNFSKKINHGEAVLLGMFVASKLSTQKKQLPFKDLDAIRKHYIDLNLPMKFNKIFHKNEVNKIIFFMTKDKKNINKKINLILLKKIGKTTKPREFELDKKEIKKNLNSYY